MRNIETEKEIKKEPLTKTEDKRIICQIPEPLLIKCQNLLTSKHLAGDFTYSNLSDLVRKSLLAYKSGQPLTKPRQLNTPKKNIGFLLNEELYNFHQSLPPRHRVEILERCLATYINNI